MFNGRLEELGSKTFQNRVGLVRGRPSSFVSSLQEGGITNIPGRARVTPGYLSMVSMFSMKRHIIRTVERDSLPVAAPRQQHLLRKILDHVVPSATVMWKRSLIFLQMVPWR